MMRHLLNHSLEKTSTIEESVGSDTTKDEEEKKNEIEETRYISLVITVTSATGLRSVDDISDPFVRLRIGQIKKKTNVMFDTEDPVWNETFYVTNIEESEFRKEHVFFNVIDDDAMGSKTCLGVCVVDCEELFQNRGEVIRVRLPLLNKLPENELTSKSKKRRKHSMIAKKLSWANTRKISRVTGYLSVRFSVRKSSKDKVASGRKKLNERALKSFFESFEK